MDDLIARIDKWDCKDRRLLSVINQQTRSFLDGEQTAEETVCLIHGKVAACLQQ